MQHVVFRFFVIDRDPFVAQDMCDGLRAACVGADVCHVSSVDELTALPDLARDAGLGLPVVITKKSIAEIMASGLDLLVQQINSQLVVRLGDDPVADILGRGWLPLAAPFSWDDLADLVQQLQGRG
ncbi:hypothetical protein [Paracoccus sp. (in: a-proteobacteria)]|uniref:hypothetical protein n=1 Tax=Paracoccus sp. TaxID=267 RepID=UPI0026E04B3A|nr:hypothetical protein [Paracoccus sp. (in: a-proteobacteria)]MDO5647223.1 hypothetical protein [Paracoccus sp. (in: a-proteobacteria)]